MCHLLRFDIKGKGPCGTTEQVVFILGTRITMMEGCMREQSVMEGLECHLVVQGILVLRLRL